MRSGLSGLAGAFLLSTVFLLPAIGASLPAAVRAGGTGDDTARSVAALPDGSAIVTGRFTEAASFGDVTLTGPSSSNLYVARVDPSGEWAWATGADGGSGFGHSISALPDGSAIVAGQFSGTLTLGATELVSAGEDDVFVARISASGAWIWATRAGSAASDAAYGVASSSDGSAIVVGYFSDSATFGDVTVTSVGNHDVFVAKVGPTGSWVWAASAGASGWETALAVSTLSDGSAIVTGSLSGTATFGGTTVTVAGSSAAFVARISASGSWLWATGADGAVAGRAVASSSDGSAVIAGQFYNPATFGGTTLTSAGGSDLFVAKVDANGDWAWATGTGSTGFDLANGVAAAADGSTIVVGQFEGTVAFGGTSLTTNAGRDVFVARISTTGAWIWATSAGSVENDEGFGVASTGDGSIYVVGEFRQSATFGETVLVSLGGRDLFVARLNSLGAWSWPAPLQVQSAETSSAQVAVSCAPLPLQVGTAVTCTVTDGDAGVEILWRAASNPVFASEGVTLDSSGSGSFGFVVPAAALGQVITVELVEWAAPVSLGVVGGPVPSSVPSGGGPASVWTLLVMVLLGFMGVVTVRRETLRALGG
jgi:hypothetical protein